MKNVGIDAFEGIASRVVVTVARCADEAARIDTVFTHRVKHLELIYFGDIIGSFKAAAELFRRFFSQLENFR